MTTEVSRPTSSASTRNLRSRSLSSRRRKTQTQIRKSENVDLNEQADQVDSQSNQERLILLLENLDIRFVDCTFTYKESHYDYANSAAALKKQSKLSALRHTIFKIRETLAFEKTFDDNCLYVPIDEKDKLQDFILANFSDVKLSFHGCKFIKRSSTFSEKIVQRFRKTFGIVFELTYPTSTATLSNCTFRVKDLLFINQHIQERIVEEG